jgi:hypothetical protein
MEKLHTEVFHNCNKHDWGNQVQGVEMVWHVACFGEIRMSKTDC